MLILATTPTDRFYTRIPPSVQGRQGSPKQHEPDTRSIPRTRIRNWQGKIPPEPEHNPKYRGSDPHGGVQVALLKTHTVQMPAVKLQTQNPTIQTGWI